MLSRPETIIDNADPRSTDGALWTDQKSQRIGITAKGYTSYLWASLIHESFHLFKGVGNTELSKAMKLADKMDGDHSVVMVMRGRAMLCGIVAKLVLVADRKAAWEEEYEVDMRHILFIILALSTFVCISCGPDYEQEEANVYSAYINKYYITKNYPDSRFENQPFSMIVIGDRTSGFVIPFFYPSSFAELDHVLNQSTLKSFLDRNDGYYTKSQTGGTIIKLAGRYPLNQFLKFGLPHTLISENEIDQIFGSGKWDEFYRRYPTSRGLVFLSRVGFNKAITQALLYFVKEYDGAAGEGFLILLNKRSGEWEKVAEVTAWIS